jgi:NAD(P)-dependent dehydrogenase (short-subunit alcohol dehydrogenase family)
MAVNLSGPFHLSQAAIPHLLTTEGNIVNVASQSATMGTAYIVAYAASKGGLVQMSRSMAMEYMREPIRINVVAPGAMRTDIGEGVTLPDDMDAELLRRYYGIRPASPPDEVAEMIVFVASDRARSIHGAVLHVDGGVTAG